MTNAVVKREDLFVLREDGSLISYDEYEEVYSLATSSRDSLVYVIAWDGDGNPIEWIPYTL